jgi:hypothetical protein
MPWAAFQGKSPGEYQYGVDNLKAPAKQDLQIIRTFLIASASVDNREYACMTAQPASQPAGQPLCSCQVLQPNSQRMCVRAWGEGATLPFSWSMGFPAEENYGEAVTCTIKHGHSAAIRRGRLCANQWAS